ncbi:hypothetical protein H5407_22170 [Mitsuaria sp. WAJ17]|uniref:hypothetical protein n=1 Tax=Mitsuaria sp. WAJ17 TaxID=2761452 RepID=UPI0015FF4831|nr:hypothetical protein [Mitsuaria sp. WAJ17]MBB2487951.1 hypothetical protein [Mitsuaria sp. WAJ17]
MFFALALTAVLLGFWRDPLRPQDRPAGRSAGMPATRTQTAPFPTTAAETFQAHPPASPAQAAGPQPTAPAASTGAASPDAPFLTAGTPVQAADAEGASDWRDSALDLLSQIGLLCPAAGCDSLEDD